MFVKRVLIHVIVEQGYCVDMFQFEVPVRTLWCLFAYRKGGIEERTVFEEFLIRILHLHDKFLSPFVLAIHVKDGFAFGEGISHMFAIEIFHILDDLKALKE